MNTTDKLKRIFAVLTMISGSLHLIIVSMMHRENFVELWFFSVFGLIQLYLGFRSYGKSKNTNYFTGAIIVNVIFITLWLLTRIFNAPFATYSEAITSFDTLIALVQIIAIYIAVRVFQKHQVGIKSIAIILALATGLGVTNFAVAKASEKVFKSIPISKHPHKHSIMDMFKAPVTLNNISTINVMGIDMTKEQAQEHCKMSGMEQMEVCQELQGAIEVESTEVIVPQGHDNSDGHHN